MKFKLSVSNIAWAAEQDAYMYRLMKKYRYSALEIAPTRIFPESPYEKTEQAGQWADRLRREYGFAVCSMQSIWFGRQEKIFGTEEERSLLLDYTKKAIEFAAAVTCGNLVFGCPRNRMLPEHADPEIGIRFFKEIGDYAAAHGTVIGIEANPPIYHTNYINGTEEALRLIDAVGSEGFMLNLDVGTMIENREPPELLAGKVNRINHVHLSEPGLSPIRRRSLHRELFKILEEEKYEGCVSIEMGLQENFIEIERVLAYGAELGEGRSV